MSSVIVKPCQAVKASVQLRLSRVFALIHTYLHIHTDTHTHTYIYINTYDIRIFVSILYFDVFRCIWKMLMFKDFNFKLRTQAWGKRLHSHWLASGEQLLLRSKEQSEGFPWLSYWCQGFSREIQSINVNNISEGSSQLQLFFPVLFFFPFVSDT
jgi:hypothetical protein